MSNFERLLNNYWYKNFIISGITLNNHFSTKQLLIWLKGVGRTLYKYWLLFFENHFYLNTSLFVQEIQTHRYNASWKFLLNKWLNKSYNLKYSIKILKRLLAFRILFFKTRRGKRYLCGLPTYGQKTRSNAKNARKFKAPSSLVAEFEKKKTVIVMTPKLLRRINSLRERVLVVDRKEKLQQLDFWFNVK